MLPRSDRTAFDPIMEIEMIKSGWLAQSVNTIWVGQLFTAYRRSDMKDMGWFHPSSTLNGPLLPIAQKVLSLYRASLPVAPTTASPRFDGSMYGGYNVKETGDKTPVPPLQILSGPELSANNGDAWRNSKRDETIVVSQFARTKLSLEFSNGGNKVSDADTHNSVAITAVCLVMGYPLINVEGKPLHYDIGGDFLIGHAGSCYVRYERSKQDDLITAYTEGFISTPLQEFMDGALKTWWDDSLHGEVTEVLATANTSTLDLLTSLAEMPETVRSIYDGLKFMLRGLKDVKSKRFSLLEKSKRVRIEYERRIFRAEYESRKAYIAARNARERRIIQAKLAQSKKQLKNDLDRTLKGLLDALASVWLNYRYNIEPTVMMIEDAIDVYFEKENLFKRWSSRVLHSLEAPVIPGFSKSGGFDSAQRVFIKRGFSKGLPFGQSLSASIFTTAWELIPLSFVLDWIVNVGDFIATSSANTLSKVCTEGSTISLKVSGTVTYTGVRFGSTVACKLSGYQRLPINPNDYSRLILNPDISGLRIIDSLALSWNLFFKKVWK